MCNCAGVRVHSHDDDMRVMACVWARPRARGRVGGTLTRTYLTTQVSTPVEENGTRRYALAGLPDGDYRVSLSCEGADGRRLACGEVSSQRPGANSRPIPQRLRRLPLSADIYCSTVLLLLLLLLLYRRRSRTLAADIGGSPCPCTHSLVLALNYSSKRPSPHSL